MKRWLVGVGFALLGCGSTTDGTAREVALADLRCASVGANGVWESAPFPISTDCGVVDAGTASCCPWLEFAGHATLRIEHGLGVAPRVVDPWIAFSPFGVGSTPASGDAVRLRAADDTYIELQNNTDQRFFLRVDAR